MSIIRGRLNQIEKRISAIKTELDETTLVSTGVHFLDDDGDIIPGGPACRVPKEQANSYGILLVPEPCQDKEDFEARYSEMQDIQKLREQIMKDPGLNIDEKLAKLDLPKFFRDYLNADQKVPSVGQ